jgi:photosystem II stability/assembly factor-like uncharacterized protein
MGDAVAGTVSAGIVVGAVDTTGPAPTAAIIDRPRPTHLLAASDLGLYDSRDAGATWTANASFATVANGGFAMQVIQDPVDPNSFWATTAAIYGGSCTGGTPSQVLMSNDNGATWRSILSPASTLRISLAVGISFSYAALADCTGASSGVMRTTGLGAVWHATATAPFNYLGTQAFYDMTSALDPTDSRKLVLAGC